MSNAYTLNSSPNVVTHMDITPNGYSDYVVVKLGILDMIIISGQLSLDDNGGIIGENDFEKQVDHIFLRLSTILQRSGGSLHHIIKLNNYLTDINNLPLFRKVRDKYIDHQNPPCSTAVQISQLFRPELLIEIEATAIVPAKI